MSGVPRADVEPLYFGGSDKPLFGCYHHPPSETQRKCGVVLCHSLGQEYIRAHRSYRLLATRLATAGFSVLRFDLHGCGDSGGDCEAGDCDQWSDDIGRAIHEIRRRRGSTIVCLAGLRLGGTLALTKAAAVGGVRNLILWDPVLRGRDYLAELRRLHWEMLPYPAEPPECGATGELVEEIAGFPLTARLRRQLENMDALQLRRKPADLVLLIESDERAGQQPLREHLESLGSRVDYLRLPGARFWLQEPDKARIPHRTLDTLVSWMCRTVA